MAELDKIEQLEIDLWEVLEKHEEQIRVLTEEVRFLEDKVKYMWRSVYACLR